MNFNPLGGPDEQAADLQGCHKEGSQAELEEYLKETENHVRKSVYLQL